MSNVNNRAEIGVRDLSEILRLRLLDKGHRINRSSAQEVIREFIDMIGDELQQHDVLLPNLVRFTEITRPERVGYDPIRREKKMLPEQDVIRVKPLGHVKNYQVPRESTRISEETKKLIAQYKDSRGL